ncbi:c-type cytochrome biogenesis protein CcmI [Mesorhizobium marinum]|uniref:c-type cytochrome biogenesis protein CcmI n=1 Tax=Mesorhizobium marinum TaxID=3228790 RepID=UPI003465E6B4
MLFWVIAGLLTLGASLSVLLPLARRGQAGGAEGSHDVEVYRDQLAELDRDAERGLIGPTEAEQARAEIARRILKADKLARLEGAGDRADGRAVRSLGVAAVLAVPLVSWGIYAATGSPDLPSQPLAARLDKNPADSTVDELVARAEAHLAANPDDARGWDVLAPIYVRIGRNNDAVTAYQNAIRLDGPSGARQSGLGEALAGAAGGLITAQARDAFAKALDLEPGQPKAAFFLATAQVQEGRVAEAVDAWRAMLRNLPADSPWRGAVEQAVAEGDRRLAAVGGPKGPTPDAVEAAGQMSEEDRSAMIETMVAGLDERLRQNPRDLEGWMRLVRSYHVLGRAPEARDALARGVAAFGEGSVEAGKLGDFSIALGVAQTE